MLVFVHEFESKSLLMINRLYLSVMKKYILFILLSVTVSTAVVAQNDTAFRKEISAFLRADSAAMPHKNQILFVGSSSFTFWKDIRDYFPGYPLINRGFGGSSLIHLIQYADKIILPYSPRQIIIYCGENDIADAWDKVKITPDTVLMRFKRLMTVIRKRLGKVPVVFVSVKPSPSRWKMETDFVKTNRLIKDFLRTDRHAVFLNVHDAMLLPDGSVNPELFGKDSLHMNARGYAIWQKIIRPVLKK